MVKPPREISMIRMGELSTREPAMVAAAMIKPIDRPVEAAFEFADGLEAFVADFEAVSAFGGAFEDGVGKTGHHLQVAAHAPAVPAEVFQKLLGIVSPLHQFFGIGPGNLENAGVAAEYLAESFGLHEGLEQQQQISGAAGYGTCRPAASPAHRHP